MGQRNFALRDDLEKWADGRVGEGRFATADEMINALLEDDRDQARKLAWLQAELDKGIASGIDPRPVEQIFADIRAKHQISRDA